MMVFIDEFVDGCVDVFDDDSVINDFGTTLLKTVLVIIRCLSFYDLLMP